ncbi:MAG: hypothetical protein COB04_17730 [Gammaproteobacteria bacterium]|nr:MAG: hypothetical protein COB04_17730 [Gammaproteobacteria bacterium]
MVFTVFNTEGSDFVIDSNITPSSFNWQIGDGLVDIMPIDFNLIDGASYEAQLDVYSDDYQSGLVWIDRDKLKIEGA